MLANPDMIVVEPGWIAAGRVRVATGDDRVPGFSVVLPLETGEHDIDGLFVTPEAMRQGIGRLLIEDAKATAWAHGATRSSSPRTCARSGFTSGAVSFPVPSSRLASTGRARCTSIRRGEVGDDATGEVRWT